MGEWRSASARWRFLPGFSLCAGLSGRAQSWRLDGRLS